MAEAIESVCPPELEVSSVIVPIQGDSAGLVLLVLSRHSGPARCSLLGVDGDAEMQSSCLGKLGTILAASYRGALAAMTGLALEPLPPQVLSDMLGAIVPAALLAGDGAPLLDSQLTIEGAGSPSTSSSCRRRRHRRGARRARHVNHGGREQPLPP